MSTFSDSYIAANASNFPAEAIPALRQSLEALDESQVSSILAIELKNPTTALIFSILLGNLGADRFYIEQIGLGIAKLCLAWLTVGIWPLIDWFLIMGATKRANLEKIKMALMAASYYQ